MAPKEYEADGQEISVVKQDHAGFPAKAGKVRHRVKNAFKGGRDSGRNTPQVYYVSGLCLFCVQKSGDVGKVL